MKKMISMLLVLAMLLTPMLSMAQENSAFDNALAAGKTLKTEMSLHIPEGLLDAATTEQINSTSLIMSFATKPAAQVVFSAVQGEETLGDLMLEVGEKNDLYIRSTLLGDEVICIDEREADVLIDKTLAFLVSIGMMTQEEADAVLKELSAQAAAEQQAQEDKTAEKTVELSMFELMSMDFGPLMDAVIALADKVEYRRTDLHAPDNADEAVEYYGVNLTGEDLAGVADGLMKMIYSSKTLSKMLDGQQITTEQIQQAFAAVKTLGVGAYLGKDGALVHLTLLPVITVDDSSFVGSVSYSRKTEGAKVTYALDLGLAQDPAGGEYTVLFNVPATLVIEENKLTLAAEVFGVKAEMIADVLSEQVDDGTRNEFKMTFQLTDPAGETVKAVLLTSWNECLPTDENPVQTYTVALMLGDDVPLGTVTVLLSAEEPSGTALASQPFVEPAKMTQDEFNAFAARILESISLQMEAEMPDAA